MNQFEIPYNFDYNLISSLQKLNISESIHCIYLPPFWEDYISAKYNYIHNNGINMGNNKKMSREEYESHVAYIQSYFPGKLMLLLQQNDFCISEQLLNYYHNLGFEKFCVGNIQQAKQIKKLYCNDEIIGSITMKILPKDLSNKEYEIFDGFVLWFPYNRNLPVIKQLPKQYKYVLLVNCDCGIYCPGTHHWFASAEDEQIITCPNKDRWEDNIRISPNDLSLFKPYITYFKLQGREYTSFEILQDILSYMYLSELSIPFNQEIIYFNKHTNKLLN